MNDIPNAIGALGLVACVVHFTFTLVIGTIIGIALRRAPYGKQ